MNNEFHRELAVRVLALVNALQYENAGTLLHLALSAEEDATAPEVFYDADVAMQFAFHPVWRKTGELDHVQFEEGITLIENWLKELTCTS